MVGNRVVTVLLETIRILEKYIYTQHIKPILLFHFAYLYSRIRIFGGTARYYNSVILGFLWKYDGLSTLRCTSYWYTFRQIGLNWAEFYLFFTVLRRTAKVPSTEYVGFLDVNKPKLRCNNKRPTNIY